jgi:hypothetical protein
MHQFVKLRRKREQRKRGQKVCRIKKHAHASECAQPCHSLSPSSLPRPPGAPAGSLNVVGEEGGDGGPEGGADGGRDGGGAAGGGRSRSLRGERHGGRRGGDEDGAGDLLHLHP